MLRGGTTKVVVAQDARHGDDRNEAAVAKREGLYLGEVDQSDNDALIMIGGSLLGLDSQIVNRMAKELPGRVSRQLA